MAGRAASLMILKMPDWLGPCPNLAFVHVTDVAVAASGRHTAGRAVEAGTTSVITPGHMFGDFRDREARDRPIHNQG